ncbi:RidA family protein [Geothrix terrae]|uniref:RidA family protein n=1 Tax=Geothrix terrae TaxID=2922720 RepID=UPI001FADD032|nr:RidA family protein [Geothrix terrae]
MKRRILLLFPCFLIILAGCAHKEPVVRYLNPATLPKPNGYSHVVEVEGGRTLYVSGQIALDKDGALVGKGDLKTQTRQVFENLQSALRASGATLDHVVKITVFMTDVSDIQAFRDVRDTYFTQHHPASSLVQVSRLARPDLLIEIEAVAVIDPAK